MYLWQTVGAHGSNGVWLAALMIVTLLLFLAPLDYLFTPEPASIRIPDAEDIASPESNTSLPIEDVQ